MKHILVAIEDTDATTISSPLIERTVELARAFPCNVWLVHVVVRSRASSPFNVDPAKLRSEEAAELCNEHEYLQTLARCMRERGMEAKALLISGATVETLVEEAERLDIDLIMLGCHRHRLTPGVIMEFTEQGILGRCPCPVMYVPM